jgi:NDP-sugar pyrophosphorylase family protein
VLEPDTFDRIPRDTPWSIERSYFPSLIERGERFVAWTYRGYWIDIGTPEKYMQVHRDIMDGRFPTVPFTASGGRPHVWTAADARIEDGAQVEGPCFIDEGSIVKAGARIKPYAVLGRQCVVEEEATVEASIVWANSRIGREAVVRQSILGRQCHVGRSAALDNGVVLGDKSVVTDFSRL